MSGEANVRILPMETFEEESCVRGYHTYSAVWVATVGEQLQCAQERRNAKDPFAVAVLNGRYCRLSLSAMLASVLFQYDFNLFVRLTNGWCGNGS